MRLLSRLSSLLIVILLIVTLLLISGCTKKHSAVEPDTNLTHVTGTLRCGYRYMAARGSNLQSPQSSPYYSETGELAKISFVDDHGGVTTVLTDTASAFDLTLEAGLYTIIIETAFTWPDTLDPMKFRPGDTSLTPTVMLDVLDGTNLCHIFWYWPDDDILDMQVEWDIITRLHDSITAAGEPPLLDISVTSIPEDYLVAEASEYVITHSYYIPIPRPHPYPDGSYSVLESFLIFRDVLNQRGVPTDTGWVPRDAVNYDVAPAFYICLQE